MMNIKAGEFWVVNLPFTTLKSTKKRPVLVLWLDGDDAVCAVVTSAKPRTVTDIALENWKNSGLKVASTVRLSRLDCLEKSLFIAKIGIVSDEDGEKIKTTWTANIKPQF